MEKREFHVPQGFVTCGLWGEDLVLGVPEEGGGEDGVIYSLAVSDEMHDQIAIALNIPVNYYRFILAERRGLLTTTVRSLLQLNPEEMRKIEAIQPDPQRDGIKAPLQGVSFT